MKTQNIIDKIKDSVTSLEEHLLKGEIEYEDEHVLVLLESATIIIPSYKLAEHFKLENEILVETGNVTTRWSGGTQLPEYEEQRQTRTDTEAVKEDLDIDNMWKYIAEGGEFEIEKV